MIRVYRYRVKGSSARRRLSKLARQVNFIWNWANDQQKHSVRHSRPFLTGYDLNNLASGGCRTLLVPAQTIQSTCEQYAKSRIQHRRRWLRYRGERCLGWVPFKGQQVSVAADYVRFAGKNYRLWLSRPMPGKPRCGNFAQDARGNWYVNLYIDVPDTQNCGDGEVGVDLGLSTTAVMSNGQKYDGLRSYRKIAPKLAKAQRARKKRQVRALHAKAKNRRLDGLHKFSTKLVSENRLVVVGDVSSQKLAQTKMAKSVYDAGWGMLRTMLRYKTLARGAAYREVNEAYSSQLCSACGSLPASRPRGIAQLGIREWVCSDCGQGHDRDVNAARNILALSV